MGTILELKKRISEKLNDIPSEMQTLIYTNLHDVEEELNDNKIIADYPLLTVHYPVPKLNVIKKVPDAKPQPCDSLMTLLSGMSRKQRRKQNKRRIITARG